MLELKLSVKRIPDHEPAEKPEAIEELDSASATTLRMLGGRVPNHLFQEFTLAKLTAEQEMGIRKITTEDAVEAFVTMLRDDEVLKRWRDTVRQVKRRKNDIG